MRYKIFGNFPPEVSFVFNFAPQFLEFSVEWFAFRKFNSFSAFLEIFPGHFWVLFVSFEMLVEWKAPTVFQIQPGNFTSVSYPCGKGRTIRKLMGGGAAGEVQKKIRARENLIKKIRARQLTLRSIHARA